MDQPEHYSPPAFLSEQRERVKLLIQLARMAPDLIERHRLLVLALYPARAIVEQLETRAKESRDQSVRDALMGELEARVPYFKLVEYARNHDFHRRTILPPIPGYRSLTVSGPFKLTARQGGTAAMMGTGPGGSMEPTTTRNSTVKGNRPIQVQDSKLFDETTGSWVDLMELLPVYLAALEPYIANHDK